MPLTFAARARRPAPASLHAPTAAGRGAPYWRGLRPAVPVAARPARQRWRRHPVQHPGGHIVVAAADSNQPQPQPGGDPQYESAAEQRRQREWEATRQELAAFQQAHGRLPRHAANALESAADGEGRLAQWCTRQRRRKEGSAGSPLSAEERAALEAIPGWHWLAARRPVRVPWDMRLAQLKGFVQQHGRLPRVDVSPTSPTPPLPLERELGGWCDRQRQRRKGNKKPELAAEEVAALEAIPGWVWDNAEAWQQLLAQVAAFQQQHGRLPRQQGSKRSPLLEGEHLLGKWCGRQRQRRKGNRRHGNELTGEQQAALEAIPGWVWDEAEAWQQWLAQLAAFQQQHGRLPRVTGGKRSPLLEGERELGQWCRRQRQRRKGNSRHGSELTGEQAATLEAIPGWVWDASDAWQQRLQQVAAFQQQHGRLPRSKGSERSALLGGERELGVWCHVQRQRRKGNRQYGDDLAGEQQAGLEAIRGWFW